MASSGYMSLGLFVFQLRSAPLQSISRNTAWRYGAGEQLGQLPGQQFLGRNSDKISLKGQLRPEITGGESQLKTLRQLADKGQAQTLVNGDGQLLGSFIIDSITEEKTELFSDGRAKAIDFTLSLIRVNA